MAREDWIFPIADGVCVDGKNGRWSDGAFFDEEDIPVEWHQAEPAANIQDREVWKHWLEFLETSPSAAESLLMVAKTRARAKVEVSREESRTTLRDGFRGGDATACTEPYIPLLTWRFNVALQFADGLHHAQARKGVAIPYIAHLMAVCALVLEAGGDEDQARRVAS